MVSTVDGAARSPDGHSAGISTDADRRVFGRLRGLADVVLAGAGTIRSERYRPARPKADFTDRRTALGLAPVPAIAVVSRSLDLDLAAPLFTDPVVRTLVITCAASDPRRRDEAERVADVVVAGDDDVDLVAMVSALHERGLEHVHCEGGPHLLGELCAAALVDELLLTVSPVLAGGSYPAPVPPAPRVLAGPPLPVAPRPLHLHHLLEDDGTLFLSYRAAPGG
jgi:riboflavin biosynthesis pyrimidine reductase